ncbi:hypothetical protein TELCIR_20211 [Teladorsagia circumcincta]|uniref:Uncharacterized protein n=1 Tax=Teladorsagia circumcincta TaxID=45464 RepID=A0A2G9TK39_TELCI|nr:hypothetical protein TELCIR_20211 [Teladorsagia circumcincta]
MKEKLLYWKLLVYYDTEATRALCDIRDIVRQLDQRDSIDISFRFLCGDDYSKVVGLLSADQLARSSPLQCLSIDTRE